MTPASYWKGSIQLFGLFIQRTHLNVWGLMRGLLSTNPPPRASVTEAQEVVCSVVIMTSCFMNDYRWFISYTHCQYDLKVLSLQQSDIQKVLNRSDDQWSRSWMCFCSSISWTDIQTHARHAFSVPFRPGWTVASVQSGSLGPRQQWRFSVCPSSPSLSL